MLLTVLRPLLLVLAALWLGACASLLSSFSSCPPGARSTATSLEEGVARVCVLGGVEGGAEQRHGPYESFYLTEDGQRKIQERGQYEFGQPVGCWERFFENGIRESSACYVEGVPHGPWQYWHEDGTPRVRGAYAKGKAHGEFVYTHPNGREQARGKMSAGQRHGEWVWRDESGAITEADVYDAGFQVRHAAFFDGDAVPEDARLRELIACPDGAELVSVEREGETGIDVFCRRVDPERGPTPHGPYRELYWGGSLYRSGQYENGEKAGEWMTFHPEGLIAEVGRYEGGTAAGPWRRYTPSGHPLSETLHQHGVEHGAHLRWHPNGVVMVEGEFVRGKRQGLWTYFQADGELDYVIEFEDGSIARTAEFEGGARLRCPKSAQRREGAEDDTWVFACERKADPRAPTERHGRFAVWQADGLRKSVENFEYGKPHGAQKLYHENGVLESEGEHWQGQRAGTWRKWSPDGQLVSTTYHRSSSTYASLSIHPSGRLERISNVVDGKPEGVLVEWYPKGSPRLVGGFETGQRAGCWTYFLPSGDVEKSVHYTSAGEEIRTVHGESCADLGLEVAGQPVLSNDDGLDLEPGAAADTAPETR